MKLKLKLDRVYCTPGVQMKLRDERNQQIVKWSLMRHQMGDWGNLGQEDRDTNDQCLESMNRILSAYNFINERDPIELEELFLPWGDLFPCGPIELNNTGEKFWIITDAGHEITTVLLPSEY
jgi:hypothetical protein